MTFSRRSLVALTTAVVAALSISGCSQATDDGEDSEGAATVGVPTNPIFGDFLGSAFKFKTDEDLRLHRAPTGLVRNATGSDPTITLVKDGAAAAAWGPPLNKTPTQNSGWFTNTKWKCVDAETWATGTATSDPAQDCYFGINTTGPSQTTPGAYGFSVVIIGLDASGNGLRSWSGSPGVRPAPFNGGAEAKLTAGPLPAIAVPGAKVNVTMDHDGMLQAMKDAHAHFNRPVGERNDCLKNGLAAGWLDIQAHYYCQLPLNNLRTCYSTKLSTLAESPATVATAASTAYASCIAAPAADADGAWIRDNQAAAFQYAMFTKQGTYDFSVESEQKVISDFYAAIGESPRPRRETDTFPSWLPDQPRYEVIRKAQVATQAAGH